MKKERKLQKRNTLIHGVGINDSDYVVKKHGIVDGKDKIVWVCPYYRKWMHMMARGYSKKLKSKRPTYEDCTICDEWLRFSNFKAWMEQQDWEGKHLDKDLLIVGNKHYSPETCVFLKPNVNTFMIQRNSLQGDYMVGVHWDAPRGKFKAQCCDPFTKGRGYLGLFDTEMEAHLAWKKRKHELACRLAELETDPRIIAALQTRYL